MILIMNIADLIDFVPPLLFSIHSIIIQYMLLIALFLIAYLESTDYIYHFSLCTPFHIYNYSLTIVIFNHAVIIH